MRLFLHWKDESWLSNSVSHDMNEAEDLLDEREHEVLRIDDPIEPCLDFRIFGIVKMKQQYFE